MIFYCSDLCNQSCDLQIQGCITNTLWMTKVYKSCLECCDESVPYWLLISGFIRCEPVKSYAERPGHCHFTKYTVGTDTSCFFCVLILSLYDTGVTCNMQSQVKVLVVSLKSKTWDLSILGVNFVTAAQSVHAWLQCYWAEAINSTEFLIFIETLL